MTRKLCMTLAMASALALGQSVYAQELLTNGSLDAIGANGQVGNSPDAWVVDATRAITGAYNDGLASEPWAGPAPTPTTGIPPTNAGDFGVFFKSFTGNDANGPATVSLIQHNPAMPGLVYTLTGWAGGEPNFMRTATTFSIQFLNGATLLSTATLELDATLLVDNGELFDYKEYALSAVSPATTDTVRVAASMIAGVMNPAGGGQAFVVDDFSLTAVPVPEPATMALLGLSVVGCMAVRRRRDRPSLRRRGLGPATGGETGP